MPYSRIRPRRGSSKEWKEANPVLQEGEIGISVPDDGIGKGLSVIKIGDGNTKWTELPVGIAGTQLDLLAAAGQSTVVITPDEFVSATTGVTGYGYRATVNNDFALATGRIVVDINQASADMGVLSIENDSFDGGFYLYAKSKPSGNITITAATMTISV